jgi:FMN-dependent NADH-azoreductase
MKIVHLDTSFNGREASSSLLASKLVNRLTEGAEAQVYYRDLSQEGLGHLTEEIFMGFQLPAEQRNEVQLASTAKSDEYIAELQDADALVVAVPMYNFSTPSQFKSWVDHVARAGVSFSYTPEGPKGLLNIKKAYVIATRGGQYAGTGYDFQAPWLEQVLKFIGVQEVEFIFAEAQATEQAAEAFQQAEQQIAALA